LEQKSFQEEVKRFYREEYVNSTTVELVLDLIRRNFTVALLPDATSQEIERLSANNLDEILEAVRGKLRRFFRIHFLKEEVIRQAGKVEGQCVRCGDCCHRLTKCGAFSYDDEGKGHCGVHDTDLKPFQCRIFPLTKADQVGLSRCGYKIKD